MGSYILSSGSFFLSSVLRIEGVTVLKSREFGGNGLFFFFFFFFFFWKNGDN